MKKWLMYSRATKSGGAVVKSNPIYQTRKTPKTLKRKGKWAFYVNYA